MKSLAFLFFTCAVAFCYSQAPVDVADNTFKVKGLGEEVFYYGFAEGDQLLFSFTEVDGKELKEVEIIELPGSSKFMDYKTKKVEGKTINVTRTAIYKFRFANSNVAGRVCKVQVQRIPAGEATKNFNTSVYWRTVYDTTYTTENEKYLIRSDTTAKSVLEDHPHIEAGAYGTSKWILPENTVAWSFYFGVGQDAVQALKDASEKAASAVVGYASKLPGQSGMLVTMTATGANYLVATQGSEHVDYSLRDAKSPAMWSTDEYKEYAGGIASSTFRRYTAPIDGWCYLYFKNTNYIDPEDITVLINAVVVNNLWGEHPVTKLHIASRQEAYLK